jgi:hypothetical protein
MIAEHLRTLERARSNLAALADTAALVVDYDELLLDLDDLHPHVPATAISHPDGLDRHGWYAAARETIWGLRVYDVHAMALSVLVSRLDEAWAAETCTGQ